MDALVTQSDDVAWGATVGRRDKSKLAFGRHGPAMTRKSGWMGPGSPPSRPTADALAVCPLGARCLATGVSPETIRTHRQIGTWSWPARFPRKPPKRARLIVLPSAPGRPCTRHSFRGVARH